MIIDNLENIEENVMKNEEMTIHFPLTQELFQFSKFMDSVLHRYQWDLYLQCPGICFSENMF